MSSAIHPRARAGAARATRGPLAAAGGRLLDRVPRLVRFAAVGGTCALLQLVFLDLLVRANAELHVANTVAFLLSTQLNFALSALVTWRDRRAPAAGAATVARRLVGYNATALGSLAINQVVFAIAVVATHYLAAAVLGILAGMLFTYTISGRVIFRRAGRDAPGGPRPDAPAGPTAMAA